MTVQTTIPDTMRTVRLHEYGEPGEVLHLETVPVPDPGAGRVRITVHACGLNPADWRLCRGQFPGQLPRGIGSDVSGIVDAVGEGVTDVTVGDLMFGTADWANGETAGASDYAITDHWFAVPAGLDLTEAAALPTALAAAYLHLIQLGLSADQTVLIHGAGGTVGFAAVQIALIRGARVIATAGDTYAQRLREFGAEVTPYGDGMVERVLALSGSPVDIVLDASPIGGSLPDLVALAGGDPKRVMTISDFEAAHDLGVRDGFHEDDTGHDRYEAFPEFAQLAADGQFVVPVARTFPLEDWWTAAETSLSGHPHGKILLLPGDSLPGA
jgi:NADPH:quinone reductase-like Zn-dependent oxidoreductase